MKEMRGLEFCAFAHFVDALDIRKRAEGPFDMNIKGAHVDSIPILGGCLLEALCFGERMWRGGMERCPQLRFGVDSDKITRSCC